MSKELAKQATAAIIPSSIGALEAIKEATGGEKLTPFDLERIRVPAGGSAFWTLADSSSSDGVAVREFEGIILAAPFQRAYWSKSMDESGGGTTPECFSPDAKTGIGTPGGECATCEFAQWGSDEGRGQACKLVRLLFVLRSGSVLPSVVVVSPGSLNAIKQYLLGIANRQGLRYHQVVTAFGLTQAKSKGRGITYSQVAPRFIRPLDEAEQLQAAGYREAVAGLISTLAPFEHAEVAGS